MRKIAAFCVRCDGPLFDDEPTKAGRRRGNPARIIEGYDHGEMVSRSIGVSGNAYKPVGLAHVGPCPRIYMDRRIREAALQNRFEQSQAHIARGHVQKRLDGEADPPPWLGVSD